ncbi:MAG: DUF5067 domain-containing protein [Oscillospiraceae bacterium]|nr:DUF5067 domain-containing protein [Oscillospiraceae bacterium]
MKRIISAALSLTLALGLAACGGQAATEKAITETAAPAATATPAPTPEPTPEPTPSLPQQAGSYKLTGMTSEDANSEEFEMMMSMGFKVYLFLNEDGSGALESFGEKVPMSWDENSITEPESGEAMNYTYADDVLTVSSEAGDMIFTRLTEAEQADYEANGSGNIEDILSGLGELIGDADWDNLLAPNEIPAGEPSAGAVSGETGGYAVEILGADAFTEEGDNIIRFYYTFTNTSNELTSAGRTLNMEAAQDGQFLEGAWTWYNGVPEDDYSYLTMAPGKSIRAATCFKYNPEGGVVALRLRVDDDGVIYYTSPKALSGAPAEPFVIPTDGNLDYLNGFAESIPDCAVSRWETGKTENGEDFIRVYYNYTNGETEKSAFYWNYTAFVLQDGYGLDNALYAGSVPEDEKLFEEVEPGESVECSSVYLLRSGSPVVVVVSRDNDRTISFAKTINP